MFRNASILLFPPLLLLSGCGCSGNGSYGDADSDGVEDVAHTDPWVDGGACGCDDHNPCTVDLCNLETLECTWTPVDMDEDGHVPIYASDGVTFCGGHDCDDTRADVYPEAPEVCGDGVDQDCDTIADGPVVMGEDLRLTTTELSPEWNPRMAWTGSEYVITWHQDRTLQLARMDGEGGSLQPPVDMIQRTRPHYDYNLVWTGERVAAAVNGRLPSLDDRDVSMLLQTSTSGELLHAARVIASPEQMDMVWTGSRFGVSVMGSPYEFDGRSIFVISLAPDATRPWPEDLFEMFIESEEKLWGTTLDWTGTQMALTWQEGEDGYFDGASRLRTSRVTPSLSASTEPVWMTEMTSFTRHDVAWTGSELGVVMADSTSVWFTRFDVEGIRTGDFVFVGSGLFTEPEIAWSGSLFAVLWSAGWPESIDTGPVLVVLEPDGTLVGSELTVSRPGTLTMYHHMAWSGSEVGVIWSDGRWADPACELDPYTSDDCNREIVFNRVGFCE